MCDLEQVEVTPRAFPGCFPCGNTAVGAAQGCGGWARNPGNVLWPGLQPSPCQAELFHSPMQLYFRNFFSELVLLLLILLKHSHGIFLIVPALGPCCPGMIQAPCPVELHGGLSLGMANPVGLMDLWLILNFLSSSSAKFPSQSHSGSPHLVHGILISQVDCFSFFPIRILGVYGWLPSLLQLMF